MRDVTSDALARAKHVHGQLNAFTCILDQKAMVEAERLDELLKKGEPEGLLFGVPIAIKDMTPTKGDPTTLGSWVTGDRITDHDAVVVERLRQAGAVVIGKTTTAEFAFSSFTKTKRYGLTHNPWNLDRTAGGSSGGSGAAVAGGAVPLAEGTDMGGSVRIPAGACGVVGFKPSLGRIPMTIVPPALETYSHFGPLASCVDDAARFVAAAAGHHPADMLSLTTPFHYEQCGPANLSGRRFALSVDLGYCEVDPDVERAIRDTADRIRTAGGIVEEVSPSLTRAVFDEWAKRWNVLLGLFPGADTEEDFAKMDPALVACIKAGREMSAVELINVDVFRAELNHVLVSILGRYEMLLCPTNAIGAPPLSHNDSDYEETLENGKLRAFDMCHPFNMVPVLPALSLPVGLTSEQLPIGLQIVGRPHENENVLSVAAAIENLVDRLPRPPHPED
ncbi:MAG: amidase [Pseudomonadota bacterium]